MSIVCLQDPDNGLGDLRLLAGLAVQDHRAVRLCLHTQVKAPTGDADDLTGSGGWDVSLALSAQT